MTLYTAIVFAVGVLVGCCVGMTGALVLYNQISNKREEPGR